MSPRVSSKQTSARRLEHVEKCCCFLHDIMWLPVWGYRGHSEPFLRCLKDIGSDGQVENFQLSLNDDVVTDVRPCLFFSCSNCSHGQKLNPQLNTQTCRHLHTHIQELWHTWFTSTRHKQAASAWTLTGPGLYETRRPVAGGGCFTWNLAGRQSDEGHWRLGCDPQNTCTVVVVPAGVHAHILHPHSNGRGSAFLQRAKVDTRRAELKAPDYKLWTGHRNGPTLPPYGLFHRQELKQGGQDATLWCEEMWMWFVDRCDVCWPTWWLGTLWGLELTTDAGSLTLVLLAFPVTSVWTDL